MTKIEIIEILLSPLPSVPENFKNELLAMDNFGLASLYFRSTGVKCEYIGSGVFLCSNHSAVYSRNAP